MSLPEMPCPIDGTMNTLTSEQIPDAVCGDCAERTTDASGRPVEFGNVDLSGGIVGRYSDTGEPYQPDKGDFGIFDCFIDDKPCVAYEYRFGGVVIALANKDEQ